MARMPMEDVLELYGIQLWGAGYFGVSASGELTVRPTGDEEREVSLAELVRELRARGHETPLIFRFPQILASRVQQLVDSFAAAVREHADGRMSYRPAFPIKVNQQREVVEALIAAGRDAGLSLEAGSRPELMAALGADLGPDSLTIVNGYKDLDTLRLAILGARSGRRVIVVIEKLYELDLVLEAYREAGPGPLFDIGIRTRLFARGAGKWWKSSGLTAKFGLTTAATLTVVSRLREAGHLERLAMVHFHIGSQIPEIRRLKGAFREGARVYAKLRQIGAPVSILNVGGGLAVDYDGSKTSSDASMNYSVQEYANDVVFTVHEVCREEEVHPPTIVSESGRALTAYHSLLVTNVLSSLADDPELPEELPEGREIPRLLEELRELRDNLSAKNYREYFHDAVEHRDELLTLFNLGMVGLEERALAQQYFWEISRRVLDFSRRERVPLEEFEQLEQALAEKYVLNFSVFQSVPDHWALEQLFPIVPITRLREAPTRRATIADITCDSDGEICSFVDTRDVKEALELHDLETQPPDQPYDVAICLLGAYQDVMGDMHNLFGAPDEAHVVVGEDGRHDILRVLEGDSVSDVLSIFGYDAEALCGRIDARLASRVETSSLDADEASRLGALYRELISRGTYLRGH